MRVECNLIFIVKLNKEGSSWNYGCQKGPVKPAHAQSLMKAFIVRLQNHRTLRKPAYSNIVTNLQPKTGNVQIKNSDIFHIPALNIDCGYSLEPPRRGGSNEYPQSMFLGRNKKNNEYPCKPQFYYIKWGLRGWKLYRRVFVMYIEYMDEQREAWSGCVDLKVDLGQLFIQGIRAIYLLCASFVFSSFHVSLSGP